MSWSQLPPFFFFSFYKWNQSELLLSSVRQKELINVFAHHECECTCWRYSKTKTKKQSNKQNIVKPTMKSLPDLGECGGSKE